MFKRYSYSAKKICPFLSYIDQGIQNDTFYIFGSVFKVLNSTLEERS